MTARHFWVENDDGDTIAGPYASSQKAKEMADALNGNYKQKVPKKCTNCKFFERKSVGTRGTMSYEEWYECSETNSHHLPNFPFSNGCKEYEIDPYLEKGLAEAPE